LILLRAGGWLTPAPVGKGAESVPQRSVLPTRITQAIVTQIPDRVIGPAVSSGSALGVPLPKGALRLLRIPLVQRLRLLWLAHGEVFIRGAGPPE
jgi:hypothetical protein